jgi:hypothetical protein
MSGPDFIIIGAMKSGTSSLQDQLARQPGIFMATPKEPNYFSDDAIFAKGPDWYGALFEPAPAGSIKGEASTHYTKLPTHPETVARLKAAHPGVRLIYVIRNPVDRAMSHYMHEWSQAVMGPDLEEAFARHPSLVDYGRYAMQIAPYLDAFGREAVYLTSLEQLKARPDAELAAIGAHIGAEAPLVWDHGEAAKNVSTQRMRRVPFHNLLVASRASKALRRVLVPKSWREKFRASRTMQARPDYPPALRARLEAAFLEDRAALAGLFPEHPCLDLCYPFARERAA